MERLLISPVASVCYNNTYGFASNTGIRTRHPKAEQSSVAIFNNRSEEVLYADEDLDKIYSWPLKKTAW